MLNTSWLTQRIAVEARSCNQKSYKLPKCTIQFKWCRYLPPKQWLSVSTTLLGAPFLPNLVTDQIQIKLIDEQIVKFVQSSPVDFKPSPHPKRIIHLIHAPLLATLCLQKLTHSKLCSCSLSLSCPKTKLHFEFRCECPRTWKAQERHQYCGAKGRAMSEVVTASVGGFPSRNTMLEVKWTKTNKIQQYLHAKSCS